MNRVLLDVAAAQFTSNSCSKNRKSQPAIICRQYLSGHRGTLPKRESGVYELSTTTSLSHLKSIWYLNAGEVISLSVERLLSVTEGFLRNNEDVLYELIDERCYSCIAAAAYKSGQYELTAALYHFGGLRG